MVIVFDKPKRDHTSDRCSYNTWGVDQPMTNIGMVQRSRQPGRGSAPYFLFYPADGVRCLLAKGACYETI